MSNETNQNENVKKISSKDKSNTIIVSVIAVFAVILIIAVAWLFIESHKDGADETQGESSSSDTIDNSAGTDTQKQDSEENQGETSSNITTDSDSTADKETISKDTTKSDVDSETTVTVELSQQPTVTLFSQVAPNTYVIGGSCSKNTEYITIEGKNITPVKVKPFAGSSKNYFTSQITSTALHTFVTVTATEIGKEASEPVEQDIYNSGITENKMTAGEYTPVYGKDSRTHFYSAILSYTLPSSKLSNSMKLQGQNNISSIVNAANEVGAETIFLIVPSSAEIYPETVPDEYKKAKNNIYSAFKNIATSCGAKVIYPVDTMTKHKNDGDGYQIYQHTDSHWSAYGAYWGTYDLMNYIAAEFPAAAPRTLSQMGFFTKEMYGGDSLFNIRVESRPELGIAKNTGIKELTTLYSLQTHTNTLSSLYNYNVGLYINNVNAYGQTVKNPNGSGLPNAIIMRDSFGKVAFDILNDRFNTVHWGSFGSYEFPYNKLSSDIDYVIYLYSERNLLKIMLNSDAASIANLQ